MRGLFTIVFLLGCGSGGPGPEDPEPEPDLGTADPSATRAGPVARPGAPAGVANEGPYAPGDRVDLGSVDTVFFGPGFTQVGITVAMPGDMDGDGLAELVVANSAFEIGGATVLHAVHLMYGSTDFGSTVSLANADVTLTTPPLSGAGGDQPWLSPAGDVNGDGLADLLVGVAGYGGTPGHVYLLYGARARSSGRLTLADVAVDLADGRPRFGLRAAGLGDTDGDGLSDFAITTEAGVHLYYGVRTGIASGATAHAVLTDVGDGLVGGFIGPAGNVDRDQYDDFFVQSSDGEAYLVRGSNVRLAGTVALRTIGAHLEGIDAVGAHGVWDLDGDELDDFVVCTRNTIAAHVFPGELSGYREPFTLADASAQLESEEATSWTLVAPAGDTNGDAALDFLIAQPTARDQRGVVYLVLGDGSRPSGTIDLSRDAVAFLGREQPQEFPEGVVHDLAGSSLAGGHDIDGDGLDDFAIGAIGDALGDVTGGRVYLVLGRAR